MESKIIKDKLTEFVRERDWEQFHTPKNLAIAIGAEVGELLECFQWKTDEEVKNMIELDDTQNIADEVADIFMYLISLCNSINIDFEKAILDKLEKNKQKYPVDKSFGKSKKYTEL